LCEVSDAACTCVQTMSTYHSSTASVSRRGRYITCHVLMLDETNIVFEVPVRIYLRVYDFEF